MVTDESKMRIMRFLGVFLDEIEKGADIKMVFEKYGVTLNNEGTVLTINAPEKRA